jgi:hypothetical protein
VTYPSLALFLLPEKVSVISRGMGKMVRESMHGYMGGWWNFLKKRNFVGRSIHGYMGERQYFLEWRSFVGKSIHLYIEE